MQLKSWIALFIITNSITASELSFINRVDILKKLSPLTNLLLLTELSAIKLIKFNGYYD